MRRVAVRGGTGRGLRLCSDDDGVATKRLGEDIGRGDSILDGEVDADTADRRHGVGGVADAEEAGAVPGPQSIDPHGQELDVVPVAQLGDAVAQERRDRGDLCGTGGRPRISSMPPLAMTNAHCQ